MAAARVGRPEVVEAAQGWAVEVETLAAALVGQGWVRRGAEAPVAAAAVVALRGAGHCPWEASFR